METQIQTQNQIPLVEKPQKIAWIKIHGEKLNSKYPERRRLYIESNVGDVDELLGFIGSVKYREEVVPWWLRGDDIYFYSAMPAVDEAFDEVVHRLVTTEEVATQRQCKYCERQRELSIKLNLPLNTWRTRYCLRHGSLLNIDALPLVDNKPRIIVFSGNKIYYTTQSVKWIFTVHLSPDIAKLSVYNYRNRRLVIFTYRNYDGAVSSYSYILATINRKLEQLANLLNCEHDEFNIYFNGEQICEVEVEFE